MRVPYIRAKTEAERRAWKLAAELGLNLVTVLPGSFGGPGFTKNTPTLDILEALMLNAFRMGCPDSNLPYVDVRDVASAHVRAMEKDVQGRFIALNDELPTFRRLLEVMFERLSLTSRVHRWRPVLERRVETIRARARALAESAGLPWEDPTVWIDPNDPGRPRPLAGPKLRVVLEKIQILEDRDPWLKGRGEIHFACRVFTSDNGGNERQTRLPQTGVFKISDRPGRNIVELVLT